jgi:hypothetical protein
MKSAAALAAAAAVKIAFLSLFKIARYWAGYCA